MQGQLAQFLRMMTGIQEPGNIDLYHRPQVRNSDGSTSTVRSMGVNMDGRETLIPTVADDGSRVLSDDDAISQYERTGRHLGKFATPAGSDRYADFLHRQQEAYYGDPQPTVPTPNDFGAGGIMQMPIPQPAGQSMRPPMQEGPAPPVSARDIMSLLGGNRGSGIATR